MTERVQRLTFGFFSRDRVLLPSTPLLPRLDWFTNNSPLIYAYAYNQFRPDRLG